MQKTHLPRPPFLRKPREPQAAAQWLVDWVNIGFDVDLPVSVPHNYRKLNQARVREWFDAIVVANAVESDPPAATYMDIDRALLDYRLECVPVVRPPWWKPVKVSKPAPDEPALLAVMLWSVLQAGLHTRITQCGLNECQKFVYSPLPKRLRRYCCVKHKNRHNRRKK